MSLRPTLECQRYVVLEVQYQTRGYFSCNGSKHTLTDLVSFSRTHFAGQFVQKVFCDGEIWEQLNFSIASVSFQPIENERNLLNIVVLVGVVPSLQGENERPKEKRQGVTKVVIPGLGPINEEVSTARYRFLGECKHIF